MKDWWLNLSLQEKRALAGGMFAVVLIMIYLFIVAPLGDAVDNARDRVTSDQKLLTWMQATDQQIQTLEKTKQGNNTGSPSSLLAKTQNNLNKSNVGRYQAELRQGENDTVHLAFREVEFDALITWLTQLGQTQGITVDQISVSPLTTNPGIVQATLTLKSG